MFEQTIEQQKGPGNRWWPRIQDYSSATDAMRNGAIGYGVVCGMTVVVALIALFAGTQIIGTSAWALLDAAFFGVTAWRVSRHSLPWAIAGLLVYLVEKSMMIVDPKSPRPGVLSILFVLYFYHAIRGGLYLRKHRDESELQAEVAA